MKVVGELKSAASMRDDEIIIWVLKQGLLAFKYGI